MKGMSWGFVLSPRVSTFSVSRLCSRLPGSANFCGLWLILGTVIHAIIFFGNKWVIMNDAVVSLVQALLCAVLFFFILSTTTLIGNNNNIKCVVFIIK